MLENITMRNKQIYFIVKIKRKDSKGYKYIFFYFCSSIPINLVVPFYCILEANNKYYNYPCGKVRLITAMNLIVSKHVLLRI